MTHTDSSLLLKPFCIGKVTIPNPLVLAPLAGITDSVFRGLLRELGAGLAYTEMISCQALHYNNSKTLKIADFDPDELPLCAQIFGSEPDLMAEAARKIEKLGYSIIDINMGCSVPKVVKSGAGSSLCRNPDRVARIVSAVAEAVSIPVTIKIRLGWSLQELSARTVIETAYQNGAVAVAVHGRTSSQKFSGHADWKAIGEIAKDSPIPVIGNGDIKTPREAENRLSDYNCVGIMIGREAMYYPWIFQDTLHHLKGRPIPPPPCPHDLKQFILQQLSGLAKKWGRQSASEKMRKFASWYTRGLPGSSRFRQGVFETRTYEQMVDIVNGYFDRLSRRNIPVRLQPTDTER